MTSQTENGRVLLALAAVERQLRRLSDNVQLLHDEVRTLRRKTEDEK